MSHGVLLVNLGTPNDATPRAVRRYLREFLSDPRVIDLPLALRAPLVHLVIAPFRAPRSAAAYRSVWKPQSPLLLHSLAFLAALREALAPVPVALAFRYGSPSIREALATLPSNDVVLFPLYPQQASSSTGTALAAVYAEAARRWTVPRFRVVSPFHADPGYLDALAAAAREGAHGFAYDHVLFSYHGLPERHLHRGDPGRMVCRVDAECCAELRADNADCYRAHAFAITRAVAARLGLPPDRHGVAFQSRLGRTPWLLPATDVVVPELARRGVKRLLVLSPSFVADCLETVEEIGIRAAAAFRAAGGEELRLVPALNARPDWVAAAARLARGAAGAW